MMKVLGWNVALLAWLLSLPAAAEDSGVQQLDQIPMRQLRVFLRGFPGDWRAAPDEARGVPPPPVEKPVPAEAETLPLVRPEDFTVGAMPLVQTLAARRSRREYDERELSLEELSFLLWSAQGITAKVPAQEGAPAMRLRASPSAGARYPLETYVFVERVAGVEPGLYRYQPSAHALLVLRSGQSYAAALQSACYGETFIERAAVVIAWTTLPYRSEWRYAYLAHRAIAMEAGHAAQNVYLAGEALGLGICTILAYDQQAMDRLLAVDGEEEFTLYLATAGKLAAQQAPR